MTGEAICGASRILPRTSRGAIFGTIAGPKALRSHSTNKVMTTVLYYTTLGDGLIAAHRLDELLVVEVAAILLSRLEDVADLHNKKEIRVSNLAYQEQVCATTMSTLMSDH